MKRIKGIILIIMVFLVSGCSIKYNINIENGSYSEEIEIPYDKTYTEDYNRDFYYDVVANKKYNTKIKDNSFILFDSKKSLENFKNNILYNNCYDTIDVIEEDNYYYIATSSEFKCMTYDYHDIDELVFTIKTYNKVKQSNADTSVLGTYKWIINRDNYKEKNILFIVSKNKYVWYYSYKGLIPGIIGILLVILIGFLIVKYFKKRSERENKF